MFKHEEISQSGIAVKVFDLALVIEKADKPLRLNIAIESKS
jgi:hypothetical protein